LSQFPSKCLAKGDSYDGVDVTLKERSDSAAPGGTSREVQRTVAEVRKRSATDGGSDERHLPTRMSTKFLWCERCNSRLVELKWRVVRVWLPLARERLRGQLAVEQLQVKDHY